MEIERKSGWISPQAQNALRTFASENSILVFVVLMFVGAALFVPHFVTPFNLKNMLLQATDIAIIAAGVTFVVLNGGIDFSAPAVLAMGSVFGAWVMALSPLKGSPWAIPAAIVVMVATGAITGAFNGLSVVKFKIPSFIATLATQLIGIGVAVWFTSRAAEKAAINGLPDAYFALGGEGKATWVPVLITVVVLMFTHWLLTYTIFGRHVYAVGTNPRTALISGVPVKRTIFMLMLLSGLYAGIQSILLTARNQAGLPSLGDKVFIDIIAAIIIGGTSVMGGAGGVKNTLYGVLFITLLNNIVNLMGMDWYIISLVKGLLVLFAAFIDIFTRRAELFGR